MKVFVNGKTYDTNKELVVLVFENDESRIRHATNVLTMPEKIGKRGYAVFPDNWSVDRIENELKPVRDEHEL